MISLLINYSLFTATLKKFCKERKKKDTKPFFRIKKSKKHGIIFLYYIGIVV